MSEQRVWLVTGCSAGFGQALAAEVAARGEPLLATARTPAAIDELARRFPQNVAVARLDLLDPTSVAAAVETALTRFGRIDVLANCAGTGLLGALEEIDEAGLRRQFEVHVVGTFRLVQAVLPSMREQRRGLIVAFSSVAGVVPIAGLGAYVAAKFALEGLCETLALEGAEHGIKVLIVEPGRFRTSWMGPSLERAQPSATYESSAGVVRERIASLHGKQPGDPIRAARLIVDLVSHGDPPLRVALGADAIDRIQEKLERQLVELEDWSDAGRSTYYPEPDE